MRHFGELLRVLGEGGVKFIIVVDVAAAGRPEDFEAIAELQPPDEAKRLRD